MNRAGTILLVVGALTAAAIVADVVSFHFTVDGIKGADWFVLATALGFPAAALIARRHARRIALAGLAAAAGILACEAVLGVVFADPARPFLWYVWPPRTRVLFEPQNLVGVSPRATFSTNSRGIRGPELSPDDRLRILCIGGSTTECLYLDDTKTWPHLLSRKLGEDRDGVWVGNLGRGGTTARDHALVLETLPEAREVDWWIVLCGANDMGQMTGGEYERWQERAWERNFGYRRPTLLGLPARPFHRNLFTWRILESLRKRAKVALRGDDWTVYQDVKAKWVRELQSERAGAPVVDELLVTPAMLDEYERSLTRIVAASRALGTNLVFVTQPALWDPELPPDQARYALFGRRDDGSYTSLGSLARGIALYNERMQEVARREGVASIDLARHVPRSTEAFYDDLHFNENGAEIVAELLARELAEILRTRGEPDALASR
jgi:lysophospholipase L1-like esterase